MTDALVETLEDLVARRPAKYKHEAYMAWEASVGQFILDLPKAMRENAAKLVANHLKAQMPAMPIEITMFAVSEMLRKVGGRVRA